MVDLRFPTNVHSIDEIRQALMLVKKAIESIAPGGVASGHTHPASDIVSGLLDNARIATGTPDGTKFLRDDQTWSAARAAHPIVFAALSEPQAI
jgi:hypothetical protein